MWTGSWTGLLVVYPGTLMIAADGAWSSGRPGPGRPEHRLGARRAVRVLISYRHRSFGGIEQGDLPGEKGRGTVTDSSSDSSTGGSLWSMASCGAENAEVADASERL